MIYSEKMTCLPALWDGEPVECEVLDGFFEVTNKRW